jgi:hypothetical protein
VFRARLELIVHPGVVLLGLEPTGLVVHEGLDDLLLGVLSGRGRGESGRVNVKRR